MQIERQTDAAAVNRLFAEPSIWQALPGATGPLDLTGVIARTGNHVLLCEAGAMTFEMKLPGLYEAHTAVLPEYRGEIGALMTRAMVQWLFTRTDAMELFTRVPAGNLPAATLTRLMGAQRLFTVEQPFRHEIYGGTLQHWLEIAPDLEEHGQWFHHALKLQYAELGMADVAHDPNPHHDRHVGAAVLMIAGGQPLKGITVYNRWASMARAPLIAIVGTNPLTIDIRDCVIVVENGEFRVCQRH